MPPPPPPRIVHRAGIKLAGGRYTLLRSLGAGGAGTVWLARHNQLGSDAVIKFANAPAGAPAAGPPHGAARQLATEAQSLAKLSHKHPHIVNILDYGESAGRPFVVMQLLEGGTLTDRLRRDAPAGIERFAWLPEIAGALDYAHANEVVHGDVKPSNILFDSSGSAYLADFGAAIHPETLGDARDSPDGAVVTIAYAAPEVLSGERPSPRSDQYSLAVSVYEALVGERPFAGASVEEVLESQRRAFSPPLRSDTDPLSRVPDDARRPLARALAREPGDRFGSCEELAGQLLATDLVARRRGPDDQSRPAPPPSPQAVSGRSTPPPPPITPPRTSKARNALRTDWVVRPRNPTDSDPSD